MVTGFVTLIGTLLSIVFWMMQRSAKKSDDPQQQYAKARNENEKLLTKGDIKGINTRLADLLDNRLP